VVDSTAAREAALIERLAALEGEIATLRASLLMALAAIEARRVADEADEALFERTLVKAGLRPCVGDPRQGAGAQGMIPGGAR
jgi:hypothetical protein